MISQAELRGILVAVLTPFDERGRPAALPLQRHIRRLKTEGVDGVLLLGTTGEGPSLSVPERMEILEAGLEAAVGMKRLACTGSASLAETIELTRHAFRAGAQAVVVQPPFFFKDVTDDGLFEFYRQVLEEAVPDGGLLALYHIPQVTNVPIREELINRLLARYGERLASIKDSAGDLDHFRALCARYPQLQLFTGNDQFLLDALRAGGVGCVSGVANVFAPLLAAVLQAHLRGKAQADGLQARLTRAWDILQRFQPYPSLLKALLSLRDQDAGWRRVRPPLVPLPEPLLAEMARLLDEIDLPPGFSWLGAAAGRALAGASPT